MKDDEKAPKNELNTLHYLETENPADINSKQAIITDII
jgi:hypothetical protein